MASPSILTVVKTISGGAVETWYVTYSDTRHISTSTKTVFYSASISSDSSDNSLHTILIPEYTSRIPAEPVATTRKEPPIISVTNASNSVPSPTSVSTVASTKSGTPSASKPASSTTHPSSSHTSYTTSSSTSITAVGSSATASHAAKVIHDKDIGAITGAAVGCLIGGALIAALITWFVMRRKNRRQRRRSPHGFAEKRMSPNSGSSRSTDPSSAPLIGAAGVEAGAGGMAAGQGWERHLPQSEADSTMRNTVQAMLAQIELHVDNYYRDASVGLSSEVQSELLGLRADEHLPDSMVGLLPQTHSPTLLIKHCLAQLVVSHISVDEGAGDAVGESFLPTDFTALAGALGTTRSTSNKPAFAPALSRHRMLTSYLRPQPWSDRTYLSQRDARISSCADRFSSAFAPWARSSQSPDARRGHLISVMKSAAETGILIFSQPSGFKYLWDLPVPRKDEGRAGRPGSGSLKIVVLPGFVKVSDESAKVLDRPQVLVEVTEGNLS